MWIKVKNDILINTNNIKDIKKYDNEKSCFLLIDGITINYTNALCRDADYKRLCKKLKVKEL